MLSSDKAVKALHKQSKAEHRKAKALRRTRKAIAMKRKGAARLLETRDGKLFAAALIVIAATIWALTVVYA